MGMFTFAYIEERTIKFGGMRNSVLALMVFFMLGFVWLGMTMRALNKQQRRRQGTTRPSFFHQPMDLP